MRKSGYKRLRDSILSLWSSICVHLSICGLFDQSWSVEAKLWVEQIPFGVLTIESDGGRGKNLIYSSGHFLTAPI
jgi:hypothetical protein